MKFMGKLKSFFTSIFVYKIVLMVFLIPTLLVQTVTFNYKLLFVMLFWGAALCLYDLFTKRLFLKAQGMIWLILFLIVFFISVVLNLKTAPNLNITSFGYTVIALILLYPDHTNKNKELVLRELSVINNIFIGMTTVLSTISFIMYIISYVRLVAYGDQVYVIGWGQNRLFGLYWNTGFMITAIGLALITVQLTIYKAAGKKLKVWQRIFYIYTAVLNFLCMCLENAKGAYLSLAGFIVVLVFFFVIRQFAKRGKNGFQGIAVSGIAAVMAVAIFFGLIHVARPSLAYLPSIYKMLGDEEKIALENLQKEEIEREIPKGYGALTGRPQIWKFGLEQFMEKPIFGYGPCSHREYHVVDTGLRHFHNLIIQCLVSVGSVGSLFIFIFFIKTFIKLLVLLYRKKGEKSPYILVSMAMFALLCMFVVNSMAEVAILFLARFSMFIFWMYLGYLQVLLDQEIKGKDDRFFEKVCNKIFLKKRCRQDEK